MKNLIRPSLLSCCLILTAVLGASCSSMVEPEPLSFSIQLVAHASDQERDAWPSTPAIAGGKQIEIVGMAELGCGDLRAEATRQANVVSATIFSEDAERMCIAITPAWQPFRMVIAAPPGEYEVRADVVGHTGTARAEVSVR
jgi:hypothetical protein